MKPNKITVILIALGATVAALAQTNQTEFENYLSTQHPEWLPLPKPPSREMQLYWIAPGVYVMDDTQWVYPTKPEFTTLKPGFKDPSGKFMYDTNKLLNNPELLPQFKSAFAMLNFTNEKRQVDNLLNLRQLELERIELEKTAAIGVANIGTKAAKTNSGVSK